MERWWRELSSTQDVLITGKQRLDRQVLSWQKDCVVSVAGSLVVLFNQISWGLAPNIGTTHLAWVITRHQGQLSWIYVFPVWEKWKWLTRVLHLSFSARYLRSRQEGSPDPSTPTVISEETLGKYLLCFTKTNAEWFARSERPSHLTTFHANESLCK